MIRGVNKQIIEVNEIENAPFYRAILFVRPESGDVPDDELEELARDYISDAAADMGAPCTGFLRSREKRMKRLGLMIVLVSAALTVCAGILLIKIL